MSLNGFSPSSPPTTSVPRTTDISPWQLTMRRILRRRLKGFAVFAFVLILAYLWPLQAWIRFALDSDTFSHVLLIPPICAYLVWIHRQHIPLKVTHNPGLAATAFVPGGLLYLGYGLAAWSGITVPTDDYLAITIGSFVLCLIGSVLLFFGADITRAIRFPLAFALFMVPFPSALTTGIEIFFQYTSAEAAFLLLKLSGTPVFRDGLFFQLPGITLEVARECSGIRSSLVLFISSLLAGHLLLHTPWRKWVLTLFVIPLGILRNAFRILVIAMLCVHISPEMIHSIIHRRGGPLFFALSLIPLFLLLIFLKRTEPKT